MERAPISALDLAHGIGGATIGMSRVEGVSVDAAEDEDVLNQVTYRANHPGIPVPKKKSQFDLVFVNKWTRKYTRKLNQYNAKGVIALGEPPRDVWARYRWTSFDINCSFYGVPQHKLLRVYIGLSNAKPDELKALANDFAALATPTQARVKDVLPSLDLYLLNPISQVYGRGMFSSQLPSPELKPAHWPSVDHNKYKSRTTDARGDKKDAVSLDEAAFAALQCIPVDYLYPGSKDRRKTIAAITSTIPPPVATALTQTILRYLVGGRSDPMDCAPVDKGIMSRFEIMAPHGQRSEYKDGRLQIVYTFGTSKAGDEAAEDVAKTGPLQPGWKFYIRQKASLEKDELAWQRPTGGQFLLTVKGVKREAQLIEKRRQTQPKAAQARS